MLQTQAKARLKKKKKSPISLSCCFNEEHWEIRWIGGRELNEPRRWLTIRQLHQDEESHDRAYLVEGPLQRKRRQWMMIRVTEGHFQWLYLVLRNVRKLAKNKNTTHWNYSRKTSVKISSTRKDMTEFHGVCCLTHMVDVKALPFFTNWKEGKTAVSLLKAEHGVQYPTLTDREQHLPRGF